MLRRAALDLPLFVYSFVYSRVRIGAVWGAAFLACGRNLWIVILAHSLAHLALVAQLYTSPVPVPG